LRFTPDLKYIFLTDTGWVGLEDLFSFLESGFKRNTGVSLCDLNRISEINRKQFLENELSPDPEPTFSSVEECLKAIKTHEKMLSELRKEFSNFSSK
jgi:hypothetical protein